MKKSLVLALVAVLVLSFASMAFAFTDTDSHWAKAYITKLVDAKVVSGTTATTFAPDAKVTRAEFAKLIVGAKGLALENPTTATFSDVPTTAWFFPYVEAAAKAGLVEGVAAGKFDPNALVTREQVAKIVVLAAGLKADDTKALNFDDKAAIAPWAKGFVAVAADAKLVEGYNNKFSPKANATRAEGAKLVYNEMVYEGKITPVTEVLPAGTYKVTATPSSASVNTIELNDKDYDVTTNPTLKIDGVYVDDMRFFTDGTLVTVTFRDDEVIALEADAKTVTGEITETGRNADDDDTLTINGKDYVVNSDIVALTVDASDSSDNTIVVDDVVVGDNYKVFLNSDNEVFAIMEVDSTTKTGKVNGKGKTSEDKYFITLDSTKYYTEKDVTTTTELDSLVDVTVDGADADWADIVAGDMVAKVELNNAGELTAVTAYTEEIEGPVSAYVYAEDDDQFAIDSDGKKYTNIRLVGGFYVGERVISTPSWTQGTLALTDANFRLVDDSADIVIDGIKKDWVDVADADRVKLIVNTDGDVTSGKVISESVLGQVEAYTENSDGEVTKVKIGGHEYTLEDEIDNADDVIFKGLLVDSTLNDKGEIELDAADYQNLKEDSDDDIVTYTVIATPFTKGRPVSATDDTYAAGGTIRIMDEDGNVYIVKATVDYVKAADDIKIGAVKVGDTIALSAEGTTLTIADVATSDTSAAFAYEYIVVSPLAK